MRLIPACNIVWRYLVGLIPGLRLYKVAMTCAAVQFGTSRHNKF